MSTQPIPATVVLGTGTLLSHGFGLALVPAMLPYMADEFGSGYGALGLSVAGGLLAYSAGALSAGRIIGRVPSRALLVGTYAAVAAGLLVAAAAASPVTLTIATVLLGFVAPVSWATTIHVAGATVIRTRVASVMAAAGSGAALGVLINGVLVQTASSIHSWRLSFVIAAAIAVLPIVGTSLVFRRPLLPSGAGASGGARRRARGLLAATAGRVVVVASLTAGVAGFPFNAFLTATGADEMGYSALSVAALWWIIGVVGTLAGPLMGRLGDVVSPVLAVSLGVGSYVMGLVVLWLSWGYSGLLAAVFGYALMNYPVWGLVGAIANSNYEPAAAVRVVSLGLLAASAGGAIGNAAAGAWIDVTGSFRGPVAVFGAAALACLGWLITVQRRGLVPSSGLDMEPSRGSDAYHRA